MTKLSCVGAAGTVPAWTVRQASLKQEGCMNKDDTRKEDLIALASVAIDAPVDIEPERKLEYGHFSPLSGLADEPDNYHRVSIELSGRGERTEVTLEQDNNRSEDGVLPVLRAHPQSFFHRIWNSTSSSSSFPSRSCSTEIVAFEGIETRSPPTWMRKRLSFSIASARRRSFETNCLAV
jgi:hypothetical protein